MLHLQKKTKSKEHIGPENQAEVMYSIIQLVMHMYVSGMAFQFPGEDPHSAYM